MGGHSNANLPFEIVLQICRDNLELLFLLNKVFTKEYCKKAVNLVVKGQTQLPLYNYPTVFPYYSFVTEAYLSFTTEDNMKKWSLFPFEVLTNCTMIEMYNFEMKSKISSKIKAEYMLNCLRNIRDNMPWLKDLRPEGIRDSTQVLEIFKNSKLHRLELENVCTNFHLCSSMVNLQGLYVDNAEKLVGLECILPNITKFEILDYREASKTTFFGIIKSVLKVFPNLSTLSTCSTEDIFNFLPTTIDIIEVLCYYPLLRVPKSTQMFNTLSISVIEMTESSSPDLSALEILQKHSKNWVLSIGLPTFIVLTNHDNFNDVVKWYPFTFERHNSIVSLNFLKKASCYRFERREVNGVYIHVNSIRMEKNALEEDGRPDIAYKHFKNYCLNIVNHLGDTKCSQWLESKFTTCKIKAISKRTDSLDSDDFGSSEFIDSDSLDISEYEEVESD